MHTRHCGLLPAMVALLAVVLGGCAPFACTPTTIVVAGKDERVVEQTRPRGLRTTGTGTVEEIKETIQVRQYWIKSTAGSWYRVDEAQFEAAAPNQTIQVCE